MFENIPQKASKKSSNRFCFLRTYSLKEKKKSWWGFADLNSQNLKKPHKQLKFSVCSCSSSFKLLC